MPFKEKSIRRDYNKSYWNEAGRLPHDWRKLGMDRESYKKLYALQEGKCLICHVFYPTLHLDHDHTNGQIHALLCPTCNRGLGNFRDNPALLRRAALYIEALRDN